MNSGFSYFSLLSRTLSFPANPLWYHICLGNPYQFVKTRLAMKTFLIAEALPDESQPQRQLTSSHLMTPRSILLIILLKCFHMCLPPLGCNVFKKQDCNLCMIISANTKHLVSE